MNPSAFLLLFPLVFGIAGINGYAAQETVSRLVMEHEVIVRVPVQPQPLMPVVDWVEHKGPKCIPTAAIRGALLSGEEQVDFVLADRGRVRAQFDEDCPALDFYGGFYLQPADELICANRDAIYSRIGGSCGIHRFRVLLPKLRR